MGAVGMWAVNVWGFGLRRVVRLVLGLIGALLLAAAVAALPPPGHAGAGTMGFVLAWAAHLLRLVSFDFGTSHIFGRSAAVELAERLPLTFELVGAGALVALVLGVPLGLVLGTGQRLRAAAPLVQILAAAPVFCASLMLLWLADHVLGWHIGGHLAAGAELAARLKAFALPALTVGAAGAAAVQLALRRAAGAVAEAPWRRGLRLMGLGIVETDLAFLAPYIFAGLLAEAGEIVLALLSATAVAEWVFDWPGAAVLFVKSVALADWAPAALVLLIFAALTLIADFLGAVSAHALAPGEAAP